MSGKNSEFKAASNFFCIVTYIRVKQIIKKM